MTLESSKNKSNYGGARTGSGRKKGSLNKETKEKREALKLFEQRVADNADQLYNAQFNIAIGCSHLFKVEETGQGKDKKRKHVLVTSEEEIRQYLDDEVAKDQYYYITTKTPDNRAIDSLLDRAFGKAKQPLVGEDGGAIMIKIDA